MIRAAIAACFVSLFLADAVAGGDVSRLQGAATKETVFRDDVGESAAGPDVSTVTVSSDDDGLLRFRVDIPTDPVLTEDMRIRLWLNADGDRATGLSVDDLEGVDAFLLVDRWELGLGAVGLFRCSGSTCSGGRVGPDSTLRFSYRDGATFTMDAAELGLRRLERLEVSVQAMAGIRFDPVERRYDLTNASSDAAPAQGRWTYDARAVRATSFSATPTTPRAGRRFVLRMGAIRTDSGAVLTRGTVSCVTRIDGTSIRAATQRFIGKQAVCGFEIPAWATGRRFRSTITVAFAGTRLARSLSGRVG